MFMGYASTNNVKNLQHTWLCDLQEVGSNDIMMLAIWIGNGLTRLHTT